MVCGPARQKMGSAARQWFAAWLLASATPVCLAQAASFSQRLDGLAAATAEHLALTPGEAGAYPAELRRIAWLQMAGDPIPDALLILKPKKDDCAIVAKSARPCKALLLLGGANGSFRVASEFPFLVRPLVMRRGAGGVSEMHYSRDTSDGAGQVTYTAFALRDGTLAPTGQQTDWATLQKLDSFTVIDRSLPTLADQRYAAEQFDNRRAKLAPFRIHLDSINQSQSRLEDATDVYDSAFTERASVLVDKLAPDVARVVASIGWPQTLEVRVWSCVDWMVPRRFWEIEDRRPGRVGVCADPLVFALRQGLISSTPEYVATARYRLLQEIGVAYLLRAAPLSEAQRTELKRADSAASLLAAGTAAGLLIGQALGLQTPEQAQAALAMWRRISEQWFREHELGKKGFVIRSPELRAYDADLDTAQNVQRCVVRAGAARPAGCSKDMLDTIERLRASLQTSLSP